MTALFLDLDGVVVEPGTHNLLPGAHDKVLALCESHSVYFFSCWAFTPSDIAFLREQFPKAAGIIRKPHADTYAYIDDRLDVAACRTSL